MNAHTATVRVLRRHDYDGIPYEPGQSYECALQFVEPLVLSGNVERVPPAHALVDDAHTHQTDAVVKKLRQRPKAKSQPS